MKRVRPLADRRGVTLIEMILTLTILAFAGSLVSAALGVSLRTWRVAFGRGREELVARIALERISSQLRSAIPAESRKGGEEAVAFDVHEDSIHFVTVQSAGGGPPAHVSYALGEEEGKRALVYREYPWPDKKFFEENKARREEFVPEITGLKVSVTPCPTEDVAAPNVVESPWKPTDLCLPGAVDIEITVGQEGGEVSTYRVSTPLAAVQAP